MKMFPRRTPVLLLLAIAAFCTVVQAAPEPADPIVGSWIWHRDATVTFKADGTVHHAFGFDGTWQYQHNPEVQRHYRIIWNHGTSIDEAACSEDGQRAHVRVSDGKQFDAHRVLDDKPAASSPASSPGVAGPVAAAPKSTAPAATALPTATADAADPIVGEWHWLKGMTVTFLADGTVQSPAGNHGTWEFVHNPEAERKYRVTLRPGKYASELRYDPVAGTARTTNTEGKFFNVAKTTAAAPVRSSESYFGASGR